MLEQIQVPQDDLIAALSRGATLVTANKRLANVTRQVYEQANIKKGLEVWQTPDVYPWDVWLHNTWEEAVISGASAEPALLLSQQQELYVWKSIVNKLTDNPLLQLAGTARQAQQAWRLMQEWQLSMATEVFSYNTDSAEFRKWASAFELQCQKKNWLDSSRIADEVKRYSEKGHLSIPEELILFGFDELTPQQQSLLAALITSSCNVRWVQLDGVKSNVLRVACNDTRHEVETAARWTRQCIEDNPTATIGIIVPELQSVRNIVTQTLDSVLVPQTLNPAELTLERPYNISLGLPLSAYPIIETAIQLLGFLATSFSLKSAGMILRSPYIRGWQQEASARALLDAYLRKNVGELEISLKTIRYYANKPDRPYSCPELVESIDAWSEKDEQGFEKLPVAQWAEKFSVLLKEFGWADGRTLSSEEYQATEAWRELLISFSALDVVADSMRAPVAISLLRTMADSRTYQPQTADLPIQVLGVLEAEEIRFDYLWIMGLHDGIWPSSAQVNPFIPRSMQKQAGMPHSSEDKALQAARRVTERLLGSADEVIVSHPEREGDNELRGSSLIKHIREIDIDGLRLSQEIPWIEQIYKSSNLETLKADPAPPLGDEDARGGSSILKHQANCPFRAFAELRLGARAVEDADIGLSFLEKGNLVHRILENLWGELKTQERLIAMEPSNLKKRVLDITNEAVAKIAWRYPQTFTDRFRTIESERLCSRIMEWLEIEKQRIPFTVINREQEHYVTLDGDMEIKTIIDRIDELEDGKKLVIDYKTGKVSPGHWFGYRPEDPQLPLYSLAAEGEVSALAIAQIRAGDMAFKGVAEEKGLLPKVDSFDRLRVSDIKDSWAEVLEEWRITMNRLAKAFHEGNAEVDPKKKETCQNTYCQLNTLCRINEINKQCNKMDEVQ